MDELRLELRNFDIEQIADSGQCFRIYRIDDNKWEAHVLNKCLFIQKNNNIHVFYCSKEQFYDFWYKYFDLEIDYGQIISRILNSGDGYLEKAVKFGSGLRILKQDLWEMIFSYVISQQNNISRITNCIRKICSTNNDKFPSPSDFLNFSENQLESFKLGYRKDYLLTISKLIYEGKFDLKLLKSMDYISALKYLKSLPGIGDKVANCIMLFGLHKIEAFPIDVWIKRIIDKRYNGNFSLKELGLEDIGGIVQQYMFFYERSKNYM